VNTHHTIMVAESSPEVRSVMLEALSDEGYRVLCCPTDHKTIESIQRTRPDLVILELHPIAPYQTLLLLNWLRRRDRTHAIPVLISSTDEHLLDDLAAPLDQLNCATLSKPFDLDQLLMCVTEALRGGLDTRRLQARCT
jgi:DNA-binding response OmpR family regulator